MTENRTSDPSKPVGSNVETLTLEQLALDNCEREPVRIPGRVQTFGAVIAFDFKTMQTVAYSDNFAEMFPKAEGVKLGADFGDIFPERDLVHSVRGALSLPTVAIQRERIGAHKIGPQFYDVAVSVSNGVAIVEFEKIGLNDGRPDASIAVVRSMLAGLPSKTGSKELLDASVKTLRRLTGFDRVMGYQFLDDSSGEVVAEAKSPGVDPYLGLRYPAADIPQVVRDLMVVNPFRIIGDIGDPHAKLVSAEDAEAIDLSLTHLRGVSPIHVEYLRNMGVQSTMHISLIVRGELWGMFSFHHSHRFVLPPEKRSVVELFGHLISLQLQQQLEQEVIDKRKKAESIINLLDKSSEMGLAELFEKNAHNLPEVVSCEGAAVLSKDGIVKWGRCPENKVIERLTQLSEENTHAVSSLIGIADSGETNGICGAAVVELSHSAKSWLLLFRPEEIESVRWAGETSKQIEHGPNGPRLCPRASFNEYAEMIRGKSQPWTQGDVEAAIHVAAAFRDAAYSSLDEGQRAWRKQTEHKNLLIAELNHRVKNILALVRSIARQTEGSSESLKQYTEAFEKRIAALSVAHDLIGGSSLQWAGIRELLETELRAFMHSSRVVSLSGPDVGLRADVAPLIALMIHELVSNAVKYGALSDAGERLEISWKEESGGLEIVWHEFLNTPLDTPTRRGFGMTLVERLVPHECNGTCDITFASSGLQVRFWLPNEAIRTGESVARPVKSVPRTQTYKVSKGSSDARIIVVEDKTLLALELESLLFSAGYSSVMLFNSIESCQQVVFAEQKKLPDIAILDINLGTETSFLLAEHLQEKGVSLIFASGYDECLKIPDSLANVPRLRKPIDNQELLNLISIAEEQRK